MALRLVVHGLAFASVANAYLLAVMITTSPRIWGYHDFPEAVKRKVPPPTRTERAAAAAVALPWLAFVLGVPVYSTYALKSSLGGEISFLLAFANPFVMLQLASLVDMLILDWLIVSRITPRFVVIPGSSAADYKDMSHHYRSHARASVVLIAVCLLIAAVASFA